MCWFWEREENRSTRRKTSKHRRDQLRELSSHEIPHQTWFQWWEAQRANRLRHPCFPLLLASPQSVHASFAWSTTLKMHKQTAYHLVDPLRQDNDLKHHSSKTRSRSLVMAHLILSNASCCSLHQGYGTYTLSKWFYVMVLQLHSTVEWALTVASPTPENVEEILRTALFVILQLSRSQIITLYVCYKMISNQLINFSVQCLLLLTATSIYSVWYCKMQNMIYRFISLNLLFNI